MGRMSPAWRLWRLVIAGLIVSGFILPWSFSPKTGSANTVVYIIRNAKTILPSFIGLLIFPLIAGFFALITMIRVLFDLPRFGAFSRLAFHLSVWGGLGSLFCATSFLYYMNGAGFWMCFAGLILGGITELADLSHT